VDVIDQKCCGHFFYVDTFLNIPDIALANQFNWLNNKRLGRTFMAGDSLVLDYRLYNVAPPGEAQEDGPRRLTFYRGQLDDEYEHFNLKLPQPSQTVTIAGDAQQQVHFSWQGTKCPVDCGQPSFLLLLDTVESQFELPWRSFWVPGSDSSFSVSFALLNQAFKDKQIAEGDSLILYWTAMASGNQQAHFPKQSNKLIRINGQLNQECAPYQLSSPYHQFKIVLDGPANTPLNFKWQKTFTPLSNNPSYQLVFDTLQDHPNFFTPLIQFQTPNHGADTAINLRYLQLVSELDKVYGKNWKEVTLMWDAKAQIRGDYFQSIQAHQIQFIKGTLTSLGSEITNHPITIFPNPSAGQVFVAAPKPIQAFKIFDPSGKLCLQGPLNEQNSLSIAQLAPGIYHLHLLDADQVLSRHQLIKY
jgi:hypothetical protein